MKISLSRRAFASLMALAAASQASDTEIASR